MKLKSFDQMEYNPIAERLVEIMCVKTRNSNPLFFRVLIAYYFSVVASMMRCSIASPDRGLIPVNLYALNLSNSGTGKNHSASIMEEEVLIHFRNRFITETFPLQAKLSLERMGLQRSVRNGTDPSLEEGIVTREYLATGPFRFSFHSSTTAALRQLRHKLLMVGAGAMCWQMDEVGLNLVKEAETFASFLELFDTGLLKGNLIKHTADQLRAEEIMGRTPTNMLLFGTPNMLLDGMKTEELLYSMLETGFARRCFFGYSRVSNNIKRSLEEVYAESTDPRIVKDLDAVAKHLEGLGDMINIGRKLQMSKETSLALLQYREDCEEIAKGYAEHEEIKKSEVAHRYFKVLKLAGAYAFIDDSIELTEDHLYQAIKLAEESGEAFGRLLTREKNHVKLAKYLGTCRRDVTQADLVEDLPFYRGPTSVKQDMLMLAASYGYQNNIIIKKSYIDGVEFLRGETLKQTDLSKMIVAVSDEAMGAKDYENAVAPWSQLHKLTQLAGHHWITHHLSDDDPGHRLEENCLPGFNLVVVDVDGGVNVRLVMELLEDYQYLIHTTKSHSDDDHHFRVILPINYELKLDAPDFKQFMTNIFDWLPFGVDRATGQRGRKWLTHPGQYTYNPREDAALFDVLPFIPKTSKNEAHKQVISGQASMDAMERWFLLRSTDGQRNVMLHRYAMMLLSAGLSAAEIQKKVLGFNNKLVDKLDDLEVLTTVMVTVNKKLAAAA